MNNLLLAMQIIFAVLLSLAILVQVKGTGLGRVWGGGGSTSFTRRGLENLLFRATFVLAFLFLAISIANLFV